MRSALSLPIPTIWYSQEKSLRPGEGSGLPIRTTIPRTSPLSVMKVSCRVQSFLLYRLRPYAHVSRLGVFESSVVELQSVSRTSWRVTPLCRQTALRIALRVPIRNDGCAGIAIRWWEGSEDDDVTSFLMHFPVVPPVAQAIGEILTRQIPRQLHFVASISSRTRCKRIRSGTVPSK